MQEKRGKREEKKRKKGARDGHFTENPLVGIQTAVRSREECLRSWVEGSFPIGGDLSRARFGGPRLAVESQADRCWFVREQSLTRYMRDTWSRILGSCEDIYQRSRMTWVHVAGLRA